MTVPSAFLAFGVVAALMTLIPGVDTALILRSAITRGRGEAMLAALGICTGVFVWGVAAAAGASAILAASNLAYQVLTYAGAAYLVFLGGQMIYRSLQKKRSPATRIPMPQSSYRTYLTGLVTNVLNPKIGVFYIAAIPQFTPAGTNALLMGMGLSAVHVALTLAWAVALVYGVRIAGRWLGSAKSVSWMDRITGTVLIGFGLKVALSRP
ncbi:LysE family translocator [Glutamicibacter arilaitensis]|uniref:LysE family translocator n=2 Tax=Glutamicibacter arilaitensis TaxID=256701 RepID=UPI003F93A708